MLKNNKKRNLRIEGHSIVIGVTSCPSKSRVMIKNV